MCGVHVVVVGGGGGGGGDGDDDGVGSYVISLRSIRLSVSRNAFAACRSCIAFQYVRMF